MAQYKRKLSSMDTVEECEWDFTWGLHDQDGDTAVSVCKVGEFRCIRIREMALNKSEWKNLKSFVDEIFESEGLE